MCLHNTKLPSNKYILIELSSIFPPIFFFRTNFGNAIYLHLDSTRLAIAPPSFLGQVCQLPRLCKQCKQEGSKSLRMDLAGSKLNSQVFHAWFRCPHGWIGTS